MDYGSTFTASMPLVVGGRRAISYLERAMHVVLCYVSRDARVVPLYFESEYLVPSLRILT